VVAFGAVGLVGFVLAFGTPARLIDYFVRPAAMTEIAQELEGTWRGFLGMVLRPFLAFAMVAWWARVLASNAGPSRVWRATLAGVVAAIGITFANLTFSFNRAAFVFPVIALMAVYNARVRRVSPILLAGAMLALVPALVAVAGYRSRLAIGQDPSVGDGLFRVTLREVSDNLQGYTGGPNLAGVFYESIGWGDQLYGGSTLLASALSPIPVIGKSFREGNGTDLFNHAIYGATDPEDQIISFAAELFANFHMVGVLAGFFALGLFLRRGEQWFEAAASPFEAFLLQYVFQWGAMLAVWSIGIYSQVLFYFCAPIYCYLLAMQARGLLRTLGRQQPHPTMSRLGEAR
jgi:hypothetical protein